MKTKRDIIQDSISDRFIDAGFKGIIYAAPRVGKIKITINCLNTKDKILIAYSEVSIKKSWQDDFKKWKFKGKKIKYSTYHSFKKLREPCDVLVLDEVHLISDAQMLAIKKYIYILGIKKVIALTGTLADDTRDKLLQILNLKVLVHYSIEQAILDGVICDYIIDVITTPLSTINDIEVKWKGGKFITSEKAAFNYISNKIENANNNASMMLRLKRMHMIKASKSKMELTKKVLKQLEDKRVLVFTGLIATSDSLGIDSYHSKSNNEQVKDDFINGKLNKLAVVKQLATGVTFKALNTAIINFFDSNPESMGQRISRITCLEYDNVDKIAHVIIISSTEQVELNWLKKSLSFFSENKINYINL
jgi:superfamily II DNA or RNA helicase